MKRAPKHVQIIAIASTLALFAAGCSNADSAAGTVDNTPLVKVIKVGDSGKVGLISSGKIAPDEEIQVVSKLAGKVANVSVKEGAVVKKGDVLVQLEATDYIDQVRQAESGLKSAQAKLADTRAGARAEDLQRLQSGVDQAKAILDTAQKSYDRMKSLYDTGAISQADLEKASLELEKARTGYDQTKSALDLSKAGATSNTIAALQAEVDRLKASVDLSRNTLGSTTITSPITGVVARRSIDPGEMASPGVPLLTIVKMDDVKVEASIPQDKINQIKVGSQVQIKVSGMESKPYTGTVDFVSPISDPNSSTFPVKIKVKNQDGSLRAGMLAEVYLSGKAESEIRLPASAVIKKENKTYVYKVDGDVVHQTEITADEAANDWVVVKGGVNASDQVVLNPSDSLTDGGKVRVN